MSGVALVSRVPTATDGAGAFARALRDPRVLGVARSLNVDLGDPGTLRALFARARRAIDDSVQVTLGGTEPDAAAAGGVDPDTIQNHYVRHAIRTYQEVSRLA